MIGAADAVSYGVTGPILRASGVEYDLRKARPYSGYESYDFEVPTGTDGRRVRPLPRADRGDAAVGPDPATRRCANLPDGPVNVDDPKIFLPPKEKVLTSMEELIHQFMIVTEGFECPEGEVYHSTEVPKGELGFYVVSTAGALRIACASASPSFNNIATLPLLVEGGLVADVIAIIAQPRPRHGRGGSVMRRFQPQRAVGALKDWRRIQVTMYGPDFEKKVDALVARYPQPQGGAAAGPVGSSSGRQGWVSLEAEEWIATRLGVSAVARPRARDLLHDVQAAAFREAPRPGLHDRCRACCAAPTSCCPHLEKKLGIQVGRDHARRAVLAGASSAWAPAAPRRRCSSTTTITRT